MECWLDAIEREGPSALILAAEDTQVRLTHRSDMPARSGAYVLAEAEGKRDASLLATGTEVALALEARRLLADHGLDLAVISVPCWERFDERPAAERHEILGSAPRFAVEAGTPLGWSDYVGSRENVFGLDDFGLSAPGPEVYEAKGLTAQLIAAEIQARLNA